MPHTIRKIYLLHYCLQRDPFRIQAFFRKGRKMSLRIRTYEICTMEVRVRSSTYEYESLGPTFLSFVEIKCPFSEGFMSFLVKDNISHIRRREIERIVSD